MSDNLSRFCFCSLATTVTTSVKKAAMLNAARWSTGTDIKVRFLEGDPALIARVKRVAEEWTRIANITFDFVASGPAEIRVAFQQGNGSWSYLGTECRKIGADKPTMNFGWLTPDSSDDEVRSVVLHEFGHALGLIHEHQNPKGGIKWNRKAVIRELAGPPNNWSQETIENNIFQQNSLSELTTTSVDQESIMMYVIPASWTLDEFSSGLNTSISEKDRAFVREIYPK